jgi:hypothetical protein
MTQSVSCEKTKSKKSRPRKTFNRDHYHRCQMSMPAIEEIENRIQQWLNPFDWKPTKMFLRKEKFPREKEYQLRSRKLDLNVGKSDSGQ